MPHQKRSAKARRKGNLRLGHPHLGARYPSRIAADKMVHGVCRRQGTDRRQHAKCVTSQENDVCRVAGHARDLRASDKLYGIGTARVLRDARIREVYRMILFEYHVFEYGTEAQGLENVGLRLGSKVDGFRIAAAFDVEDSLFTPAMLVVTDQVALGVSR